MIFFTALVLSANLYFIKPDYYAHRVTVDIAAFCQDLQDYSIKSDILVKSVHGEFVAIGIIQKVLAKSITYKRARDRLRHKVQRQLDVRIIG